MTETTAADPSRAHAVRLLGDAMRPDATERHRERAWFAVTGYADLEALMEADDIRRENDAVRCVMHARQHHLGLSFSASDAATLHRAMKRHGMVP